MKYVVQLSGGLGSFGSLGYLISEAGIAVDNIECVFADTKIEDEDLYRFLDDTEDFFKLKITKLTEGRTPWELFFDQKIMPRSNFATCSVYLKGMLCKKYIKEKYTNIDNTSIVFGIGWMEQHRKASIEKNWKPYNTYFPLIEDLKFDPMKYFENTGIKKPRLYDMGFVHNNCGGFCVKAGKAHFLNLLDKMPERYKFHEEKELELQKYLGKDLTILKEQKNNEIKKITLRELRLRAEEIKKTDEGKYDWGGCSCFSTDENSIKLDKDE